MLTHPDVDLGAHVELSLEELGRGVWRAAAARRQRAVRREAVAEAEVWQQQTQHTVQLAPVRGHRRMILVLLSGWLPHSGGN